MLLYDNLTIQLLLLKVFNLKLQLFYTIILFIHYYRIILRHFWSFSIWFGFFGNWRNFCGVLGWNNCWRPWFLRVYSDCYRRFAFTIHLFTFILVFVKLAYFLWFDVLWINNFLVRNHIKIFFYNRWFIF